MNKKKRARIFIKVIKNKVDNFITYVGEKISDLLPSHYGMNDAEYPEWYIKQMNEKKQENNEE